MVLIRLSAILLLFSSGLVSAAPTAHVDEFPNMVVLIRNSMEESFAHSPAVADKVKAEIRSGFAVLNLQQLAPRSDQWLQNYLISIRPEKSLIGWKNGHQFRSNIVKIPPALQVVKPPRLLSKLISASTFLALNALSL